MDRKRRAPYRGHRCARLDLEAGGRIGQWVHAVLRESHPLLKDDHLATAVSPGMHLCDGRFRVGCQVRGAAVEKDEPGGGGWQGADPVSWINSIAGRRKLPDLAPEWQDLYDAAHLGQGSCLSHGPAKPGHHKKTAENEHE
jgi:hypothetical protein